MVAGGDGTDWGTAPVNGSEGINGPSIPNNAQANFVYAIHWDAATSRLYELWSPDYGAMDADTNTLAAFTLGSSSLTRVGCWSLDTQVYAPPSRSRGMADIPASFLSDNAAYLGTKRLALLGGPGSSPVSSSMGPSMFAIDSPTPNACPELTDTPVAAFVPMMFYPYNAVGPDCFGTDTDPTRIGCTPDQTPTEPYPARTGYTGYSTSNQRGEWVPYAGVGYHNSYAGDLSTWYDDGLKYGYLTLQTLTGGWTNGPVVSGSIASSDLTVTLGSLDTHDGGILTVGMEAWVATCVVGVDTGCSYTQSGNVSRCEITSVNTGTKTVVCHVYQFDVGSGAHAPVVGGGFYTGETYIRAYPWYSRGILWSQLYDPADFAAVLAGGNLYDPEYYEETSLAAAFPFFGTDYGCPTCTTPGIATYGNGSTISTYLQVFADNDAGQIIIVNSKGKDNGGGTYAPVFYVFDVAH